MITTCWVTDPNLDCVVKTIADLIIDYSAYSTKRAFSIDLLFFLKKNSLEVFNITEA